MSQALDDRWWQERAGEVLEFCEDLNTAEVDFLNNIRVRERPLTENQARWFNVLCERAATHNFIKLVEFGEYDKTNVALEWIFRNHGLIEESA